MGRRLSIRLLLGGRFARSTAQSTSGRSSSQVTSPLVARSMAGHRSAGTGRLPFLHWLISTGLIANFVAKASAGSIFSR